MKKLLLIPALLLLTMESGLAGMVYCPGKYTYSCCAVLHQGKPSGRVEHYQRTDNQCPIGYRSIPCTEAEAADSSKVQGVECIVKK